ncbi:subtilisin-like protease SBT1.5 [Pistacia vera]|uniref:subtilisin-like protease SBT1.5 n=1 Tax=Pistacia vera TaxID=55513 RepID=UPI001262B161|nr:subtilisin-like protease SBT1.5 [Pistacia vera]
MLLLVTSVVLVRLIEIFPADVSFGKWKIVFLELVFMVAGFGGPEKKYSLVYAGSEEGDAYSASLCFRRSLILTMLRGTCLCDRGINSRAAKGEVVKKAGWHWMILARGFDGKDYCRLSLLPATSGRCFRW